MWWKYRRFITLEQKIKCLSSMRTVKKVDVIPALKKMCFGTICANAARTAESYISKVCGVKRVNTCGLKIRFSWLSGEKALKHSENFGKTSHMKAF
jgi:hypothetical protein